MGQKHGVFFAALFACILLTVPLGVHAQQIPGHRMGAPRAVPTRPMRSGQPVALGGSSISRSTAAPGQRWNGVRVNGSRNLSRAGQSGNNIRDRHAQDAFGFGGAPLSLQQLLNITPTNGFDWQYVNAINQDLPLKAIVDPVTRLQIAQAERLLRIGGGQFSGAFILGGGYGYYMPEETAEGAPVSAEAPVSAGEQEPEGQQATESTQPRVIVLQQKAGTNEAQESAPPTVPDRGPLMLVLRDGQKIEAIAFTVADAKIVYITPDGARKTIDAAELDSAATVRLNQENGTPLQLPSLGNS